MEQLPTNQGGGGEQEIAAAEEMESPVAARIWSGLEAAEAEQRVIDDATAREVAR